MGLICRTKTYSDLSEVLTKLIDGERFKENLFRIEEVEAKILQDHIARIVGYLMMVSVKARELGNAAGLQSALPDSLESLAYKFASYDFIITQSTNEYFEEFDKVLERIGRLTKAAQ